MFDWLIKGGQIIDGSGKPPFRADIAGNAENITEIDTLSDTPARLSLDASGCYVCPGFIDAHSHSDAFLLVEQSAQSKIYQGVTTEIIGNCGASAAPINNITQLPFDWQLLPLDAKWRTMAEYLELVRQRKPAVNIVPLVGHNRLRIMVMGYDARHPSAEEMKKMEKLLEKSLDEGGWGLSTGLIYRPGKYAAADEITRLAEIVARRNGIYTSHMRNESKMVREAVAETLEVGKKTGVRIEISHLKTSGSDNWRFVDEVIGMIKKAKNEGLDVAADRYPYTYGCTDLDILLPDWITAADRETILKNIKENSTRRKLIQELSENRTDNYWQSVIIGTSSWKKLRGRTLSVIAKELRMPPAECVLKILEMDELKTQAFFGGMNEQNMWKILSQPFVMIGSDASSRVTKGILEDDHPHPRAYGSFARFLRAALDKKTVPLEEAVRKMTSLPAGHFNIKRRGTLAAGNAADIVVFDPRKIKDLATYEKPRQLARGIRLVMVNGVVALDNGKLTGNRPGQVLRLG
jgi:N-acyl-D-amino-acid deacylase